MLRFFLLVLAVLVVLSLVGYTVYLLLKLRTQKRVEQALLKQAEEAQTARFFRIIESVEVITQAMLAQQCDFSEGVLRLKPLLDVLGHRLAQYPAMWALYEVVQDMPILDERKNLKRNERMRLDLVREAKEAELGGQIRTECRQLLLAIEEIKKAI